MFRVIAKFCSDFFDSVLRKSILDRVYELERSREIIDVEMDKARYRFRRLERLMEDYDNEIKEVLELIDIEVKINSREELQK